MSAPTDRYGVLNVNGQILLNAGPSPRGEHGRLIMLTCPWRWGAIKRGIPETHTAPLTRGSLVHVGNAQALARRMAREQGQREDLYMAPPDAIAWVAAKEDAQLRERGAPEAGIWAEYAGIASEAVRTYEAAARFAPWRIIAVEHLIELWAQGGAFVPAPPDAEERRRLARSDSWEDQAAYLRLGAPYLATARIDLIRQNAAGKFEIVDHKTTGHVNQAKRLGFDLSGQMIMITIWGAMAYGPNYGGTWVNAIEIPDRLIDGRGRPTKVRAEEWAVAAMPPAYADFATRIEDAETRMRQLVESGRPMERWTRALAETGPCWDRYGPCGMRDACMGGK